MNEIQKKVQKITNLIYDPEISGMLITLDDDRGTCHCALGVDDVGNYFAASPELLKYAEEFHDETYWYLKHTFHVAHNWEKVDKGLSILSPLGETENGDFKYLLSMSLYDGDLCSIYGCISKGSFHPDILEKKLAQFIMGGIFFREAIIEKAIANKTTVSDLTIHCVGCSFDGRISAMKETVAYDNAKLITDFLKKKWSK